MNGKNHRLWRFLIVVLIPIALLSIILLNDTPITRWIYVVSVMVVFWITEAVPYSITSLMPIGMFPMLGIMSTADISKLYAHEMVFTFLGSLIIVSSIEACNLHKRIALKILCHVNCYHRRLHFVLMTVTMFISMWMLNFFVVVMMSTICLNILEQLEEQGTTVLHKPKAEQEEEQGDSSLRPSSITICYLLGISYAATLGGCGSLLGTPTNLAFKGIFETYFPSEPEIDYLRFSLYCAPIVLFNTILTWLWLQFLLMGLLRPKSNAAAAVFVTEEVAITIKENINQKYIEMGVFSVKDGQVATLFVIFHLVLFSRPYWAPILAESNNSIVGTISAIKDASPTILFVILLFIMPTRWNCCKCCRKSSDENYPVKSLLVWTCVRRKLPWGIIFLLGAGIALTNSGKELKIHIKTAELIGENVYLSPLATSFIMCLMCQILTEFLTNTTAAVIVLPFMAAFCANNHIGGSAIDLMFPAALSLSMAFHSSIGTPGNVYVADLVNIPAKEIFYCGIGPSIITLLTYWSTVPTYGRYIYEQINISNATAI